MGLLKDKLRHIKHFKSLFEQKSILIGNATLEVIRKAPLTGGKGVNFTGKMRKQSKGII